MTDKEALILIKTRLETDVGFLIDLILEKNKEKGQTPRVPFWAFVRMLFPIAESIGDLLYRDTSSQNLLKLFQNDLSKINADYKKTAALITIIYRHALTHKDEIPMLIHEETRTYSFGLGFAGAVNHLEILNLNRGRSIPVEILFDISQFYKDLCMLLEQKMQEDFGGRLAERYESWKLSHLPTNHGKPTAVEKVAIEEAQKLHEGWAPVLPYVPPDDPEEFRKNPWPYH